MRRVLAAALLILFAVAATAETKLALPSTIAGRKFAKFIGAFNSGDREKTRKFIADNYSRDALAAHDAGFRAGLYAETFAASGGFDLAKIERSEDYELAVLGRSRQFGDWCRITLVAEHDLPYGLRGMEFEWVLPPPELAAHGKLTDQQVAADLDKYMDTLAAAGQFSGVVLVANPTQPIFEKAYGTYGEQHLPIPTNALLGLASIGKTFTAVAIGQLVDAGKLRFDDPVSKFFPDTPRKLSDRITLHMLLTHTAGLAQFGDVAWFKAHPVRSEQEYVPLVFAEPMAGEPGGKFSYSNGGYMVLAGIIEKVTGQAYGDYVREHILKPAGMTLPGGTVATARDLWRFATALRGGKLVSPATRDLLLSPKVATDGGGQYGYGFEITDVNGERIVGHDGGGPDISDRFDMYMGSGYTAVAMSNRQGGYGERVGTHVRALLTQK